MSYTIEVFYCGQHGRQNPAVAVSAVDLDVILDEIEAQQQPHPPVLVARERPKFGPFERPDHQLKIDVDASEGVGAVCFFGPVADSVNGTETSAWITLSDGSSTDSPSTLFLDKDTRTAFPADAVVPIGLVRQAVQEFRETGERPTCVRWQESEIW